MLLAVGNPTSDDLDHDFSQVASLGTFASGRCSDVLTFIVESNPKEESAEFVDIDWDVYSMVSQIIYESDAVPEKPRLTYYEDECILLVETRSEMHEVPFNHLRFVFYSCLRGLDRSNKDALVHIICQLWSTAVTAIPDMAIRMSDTQQVLVIGECAFSQRTDSVLRKIKYEIGVHPEVLMVIMVVIDEDQPYRAPERMSEAWQTLRVDTLASARSRSSFLSLRDDEAGPFDQPIVIAGHTWCHLASVRFYVWVRGNEPIDVDVDDNELLARGTLYPNQDMDAATAMIEKGLGSMKDYLVTFRQKRGSGSDVTAL